MTAEMASQSPALFCYVSSERPVFSSAECDAIINLGERRPIQEGLVQSREMGAGSSLEKSQNRDSSITFLGQESESDWIYRRLLQVTQDTNRRFWNFVIDGAEKIQFARYGPDQHYDWHMDLGSQGPAMYRKLSLTVQLSDPASYADGDLEFKLGRGTEVAARDRGTVTIFPSYILHRVRPVTRGQRCSLVQWVLCKEPFR